MGKLSNVLNALAIGIGGVGEGYGKGMLEVAMKSRDEVHAQLREDRAAAREAAQAAEERKYDIEQKEADRGFDREKFGAEMAWEREKFGLEEGSEEKKLRLAASLRPKTGGSGGTKQSAEMQEVGQVAAVQARLAGREKPTDEDWMAAYDKVNSSKSSGRGESQEPAGLKVARFKAVAKYGAGATDQQVAEFLTQEDKSKRIGIPEAMRMAKDNLDVVDPNGFRRLGGETEQVTKEAKELTHKQIGEMGGESPWKMGEAKPASENPQESVSDVEQPGVVDAPATAAKGKTEGAPRGAGTERSPYLAETEAEVKKAIEMGGPGAFIEFNGQIFRVPGGAK